jgi:hypothetical protein
MPTLFESGNLILWNFFTFYNFFLYRSVTDARSWMIELSENTELEIIWNKAIWADLGKYSST